MNGGEKRKELSWRSRDFRLLHISLKFGRLWTFSAGLLNELKHIGFPFTVVGNDAVEIRSHFDGSFSRVIQRRETVDKLSERPKVVVHFPIRRRFGQKRRLVFAEL